MFARHLSLGLLALLVVSLLAGCSGKGAPTATKAPAATDAAEPANPDLILATTTSLQDSGLLDVLIPLFEKQTGYKVKTIAVGSGQAMTMGERGEADVLLVHAPDSEKTFVAAGHGVDRRLVMHNDFIILGPTSDPAKIKGEQSAIAAMQKIAQAKAIFVGRGDNSGTDQLEQKLWKQANITPRGEAWYQQTGQGMGATLNVAAEKSGYTISDRATWLANQKNLSALAILYQGDAVLLNGYHVIRVNPSKSNKINAAGAKAFADFVVAKDTQQVIGSFVDKNGHHLFIPDATKTDADLGM